MVAVPSTAPRSDATPTGRGKPRWSLVKTKFCTVSLATTRIVLEVGFAAVFRRIEAASFDRRAAHAEFLHLGLGELDARAAVLLLAFVSLGAASCGKKAPPQPPDEASYKAP